MEDIFLTGIERLYYHRLDFRLSPVAALQPDAWLGAVLRNSLLYAAATVPVDGTRSLFSVLETYPGEPDFTHPFYKEWAGGFPKGFSLGCPPFFPNGFSYPLIRKNEIFTCSLCLIGHMAQYASHVVEAMRGVCERGIGKPVVPLQLVDVSEWHPVRGSRLIALGNGPVETLESPVRPCDCFRAWPEQQGRIELSLETPLCLVRKRQKADPAVSYQDKQNGFPSFYQFVRSLAYRLMKLHILYAGNGIYPDARETVRQIDEWIGGATAFGLETATLRSVTLTGPPRKENRARMVFTGYTGAMAYAGNFRKFLPLLVFAESLGVGNDTVYGLGKYRVTAH